MPLFLLTNWKVMLAVVAAAALCYTTHELDRGIYDRILDSRIAAQKDADVAECNVDKQTTKEATDALQKNRDELAARLAALKLQRPASCVLVTRSTNVLNRGDRPARQNERGLSSDWLLDFSANECSNYWRQLKVCDKFLDDERK